MNVSGMTVLWNAVRRDYPFLESIRAALPLCDEFVAVIGNSDDGTLEAVRGLADSKIRIVETTWSEKVSPRKCILAQQTNIGLHLCSGDWVVYLQANEVLHEDSLPVLTRLMGEHEKSKRVEALLLERLTFWGDYDHVVRTYPARFKYSPRIVRPYIGTYSIRDAMSFAIFDGFSTRGRYPRAVDTGQDLFRYGLALPPDQLKGKLEDAPHINSLDANAVGNDYFYRALPKQAIAKFRGTHPSVMKDRIDGSEHLLDDNDSRWRMSTTFREKQRLAETRFYSRFGIPPFRNKRYSLPGGHRKKDRWEDRSIAG